LKPGGSQAERNFLKRGPHLRHQSAYERQLLQISECADGIARGHDAEPSRSRARLRWNSPSSGIQPVGAMAGKLPFKQPTRSGPSATLPFAVPRICRQCSGRTSAATCGGSCCPGSSCHKCTDARDGSGASEDSNFSARQFPAPIHRPAPLIFISISASITPAIPSGCAMAANAAACPARERAKFIQKVCSITNL